MSKEELVWQAFGCSPTSLIQSFLLSFSHLLGPHDTRYPGSLNEKNNVHTSHDLRSFTTLPNRRCKTMTIVWKTCGRLRE